MQRVYGVSYPSKDLLDDYKHRMEEAKRRDHRNVGIQQQLFFFDKMSPGSCFFLPNGARIYNQLMQVTPLPKALPALHGPGHPVALTGCHQVPL